MHNYVNCLKRSTNISSDFLTMWTRQGKTPINEQKNCPQRRLKIFLPKTSPLPALKAVVNSHENEVMHTNQQHLLNRYGFTIIFVPASFFRLLNGRWQHLYSITELILLSEGVSTTAENFPASCRGETTPEINYLPFFHKKPPKTSLWSGFAHFVQRPVCPIFAIL